METLGQPRISSRSPGQPSLLSDLTPPRTSPSTNLTQSYWDDSKATNLPSMGDLSKSATHGDSRTQLFIGNLPFRVRWQDLKDLFRKCGTVLRADVALTLENRSKGFGTVLFAHESDAMRAIETFNGFNWQSRVLDVRLDQQDPSGAIAIAMASQPQAQPYSISSWQFHSNHLLPVHPPPLVQHQSGAVSLQPSGSGPGSTISRPSSSASNRAPSGRHESSTMLPTPLHQTISPSPSVTSDPMGSVSNHDRSNVSTPPEMNVHARSGPGPRDNGRSPPRSHNNTPAGHQNGSPFVPMYGMPPSGTGHAPHMYAAVPYGYPVPLHGGLIGYYHVAAPTGKTSPSPAMFANRHLFVGNLPFNCQWQDLKDLFRAAGNILRADITLGPDGRSRGFGTVLLATPEDAQRAVEMFNGYDYNGRTLKVHFDKYTQLGPHGAPMGGSPQMQPVSNVQLSNPVPHHDLDAKGPFPEHVPSRPSSTRPDTATTPPDVDGGRKTPEHTPTFEKVQSGGALSGNESASYSRQPPHSNSGMRQAPGHLHFNQPPSYISTGPAALMSPSPNGPSAHMSPQTARVAMTPSMPGFHFHPFPQTPPLVPQFLSPGLGPFSPTLSNGPFAQQGHNPYFNQAPGAPLHLQALASPDTPGFGSMLSQGYFPMIDPITKAEESSDSKEAAPPKEEAAESVAASASDSTSSEKASSSATDVSLFDKTESSSSTNPEATPVPTGSALLARRASTNSKAVGSPVLGLGPSPVLSSEGSRRVSASATRSDFGLSSNIAELSLANGSALSDDGDRPIIATTPRRASAFTDTRSPNSANSLGGGGSSSLLDPATDIAATNRRASFEASSLTKNSRLEFGQSIWS